MPKSNKLSPLEKIQKAEELLHKGQVGRANDIAFSDLMSIFDEAIKLAPKKSQVAGELHVHKGIALGIKSKKSDLKKKEAGKSSRDSLKEMQAALKADPNNLLAKYYVASKKVGAMKEGVKKDQTQVSSMKKILESDPITLDDHQAHALAIYWLEGAEAELQKLREVTKMVAFKSDFMAFYSLAMSMPNENHEEAIFVLRKAIECEPDYVKGYTRIGATFVEWAREFEEDGDKEGAAAKYAEAEKSLKKARDLRSKAVLDEDCQTLDWLSDSLFNQQKFDELYSMAMIGIKLFPNEWTFYESLALAIPSLSNPEDDDFIEKATEALAYWDRVIELKPGDMFVKIQKAKTYIDMSDHESALKLFGDAYRMLQKTKASQAEYDTLKPNEKRFVDHALNSERQDLVDKLNHLERERVDESEYEAAGGYELEAAKQVNVNITKAEKAGLELFTDKKGFGSEAEAAKSSLAVSVYEYSVRTKDLHVKFMAIKATHPHAREFLHAVCTTISSSYSTALNVVNKDIAVETKSVLGEAAKFASFIPFVGGVLAETGQFLASEYNDRKLNEKFGKISHYFSTTLQCSLFAESFAIQLFEAQQGTVINYTPPKQCMLAKVGEKLAKLVKGKDYAYTTPVELYAHAQATKLIEEMTRLGTKKCRLVPEPDLDLDVRAYKFVLEVSECKNPDLAFGYMDSVLGGIEQVFDSA